MYQRQVSEPRGKWIPCTRLRGCRLRGNDDGTGFVGRLRLGTFHAIDIVTALSYPCRVSISPREIGVRKPLESTSREEVIS
jgi:hypothetical protein